MSTEKSFTVQSLTLERLLSLKQGEPAAAAWETEVIDCSQPRPPLPPSREFLGEMRWLEYPNTFETQSGFVVSIQPDRRSYRLKRGNFAVSLDQLTSEQRFELQDAFEEAQFQINPASAGGDIVPVPGFKGPDQFRAPSDDDGSELLQWRFLCRGGALQIAGHTGLGKSSLGIQFAMCWAIGQETLGIEPSRPLRSLIVQAENDDGDIYEMVSGVSAGLEFDAEQRKAIAERVVIGQVDCTGEAFAGRLEELIAAYTPDLLWIDPFFAFAGCDVSRQGELTKLLRTWIDPVLKKHGVGLIILHHRNKPGKIDDRGGPKFASTAAYDGSGSMEIANWCRAVLTIEPIGAGVFKLIAGKRGSRLHWHDDAGNPTEERLIKHGEDGLIYWQDASQEDVATAVASSKKARTKEDLLAQVPLDNPILKKTLKDKVQSLPAGQKIGVNKADAFIDELVTAGQLFELEKRIPGRTRPLIYISRKPTLPENLHG